MCKCGGEDGGGVGDGQEECSGLSNRRVGTVGSGQARCTTLVHSIGTI